MTDVFVIVNVCSLTAFVHVSLTN